jgi:hypothetical protein
MVVIVKLAVILPKKTKMKKYLSITLLLFIINLSFSQEKKKIFYNDNFEEVTESNFYKQKNYERNLDLYFENDTLITSLLIKRKNYGQLNDSIFKKFQKNLLPNKELIYEIIVIIYYPGKDNCNRVDRSSRWNIFDNDYLKKLNKITKFNHFWIYKDDENLKYYHPRQVKWEKDNNQFIEKTFFELHYPCFSAVVIDKSGKYISYFGEFGKSTIWELTTELINKKEEK